MFTFLSYVLSFLKDLLSIELINGITLYTIFFVNMFLVSLWAVTTRRG